MDLPVELRVQVYRDHFILPEPMELWAETGDLKADHRVRSSTGAYYRRLINSRRLNLSFLRTCKQIHEEAAQVFYGQNEFRFSGKNGVMIACGFIHKISVPHWKWIQHLTIAMPLCSEDESIFAVDGNPSTKKRVNEVCDNAPFPFPKALRWDYSHPEAFRLLFVRIEKMESLKTLSLVLPETFRLAYSYFRYCPLMEPLDKMITARPYLNVQIIWMVRRDEELIGREGADGALDSIIRGLPDRQPQILGTLKKLGVWHHRVAYYNRWGRWALEDWDATEGPLDMVQAIRHIFAEV